MARGATSVVPLPKVSFEKVTDEEYNQPAGVTDLQARSYGYNGFNHFQMPEHYIRYIEPLDSELSKQVEYDMDEQDQEWLDAVNQERKLEQVDKVSYEAFEIIMDRLEKEWFDITKNIPKPDMALPSEDSTCAICDDAEGENANAIVFCDGCNLAVHQDCYGVPYIPEGQWLCRKCSLSPENPVSCILCPNEGGAFKQTTNGEWAHLLCAIWVPETRVANDTLMEPITGVDMINKQRWKLKCSLCRIPTGACIQCSKSSCFLAFHATCARKQKLLMPMKVAQGAESATLTCYCEKHLPKEQLALHEAAMAALDDDNPSDFDGSTTRVSKKARAYAKTYKLGPPLVPAVIVNRILEYISRVHIRKKIDFVQLVCRYWSLKREARRGAPLLKRLHLSPWSAGATGKTQTEEELAVKLDLLKRLRKDLETVRMLAEQVRKREAQKQKQVQIIHDLLNNTLFPHLPHLYTALDKIEQLDRNAYFKNPVSRSEVPDYFDVIEKPMCWRYVENKLDANEYWNVKDFEDDINLVLDNAILYNKPDTIIYKNAMRIKHNSANVLGELHKLATHIPSTSPESGRIGDLEAPMSIINLLSTIEPIQSELPFLLTREPIESLFAFDPKPLPKPLLTPTRRRTPLTSAATARSGSGSGSRSGSGAGKGRQRNPPKVKRDRKAEAERRKQRMLDAASGFRGPPRTRNAHARAEAFEAEARAGAEAEAEAGFAAQGGSSGRGDGHIGGHAAANTTVDAGAAELDPNNTYDSEGRPSSHRDTRRWKRPSIIQPGQVDVPPVVEDVDTQDSFNMFDRGWILPTGTRRGNRAPCVERGPPPRKKSRSDRQHSTLSISTPATENFSLEQQVRSDTNGSHSGGQWGGAEEDDEEGDDSLPHKREKSVTIDLSESFTHTQPSGITEPPPTSSYHANVELGPGQAPPPLPQLITDIHSAPPPPLSSLSLPSAPPQTSSSADNTTEPALSPTTRRRRSPRPKRIVEVIEELDTPAIRRSKNLARKQRRQEELARLAREEAGLEDGAAASTTTAREAAAASVGSVRVPFEIRTGMENEDVFSRVSSPLSALTDMDEDADDGEEEEEDNEDLPSSSGGGSATVTITSSNRREKREAETPTNTTCSTHSTLQHRTHSRNRTSEGHGHGHGSRHVIVSASHARKAAIDKGLGTMSIYLQDNELLEKGTLVWAKFETYPWWPAVVYGEDDPEVPENVLDLKERPPRGEGPLLCVQFMDKKETWSWLRMDKIKLLNEDKGLDAIMLNGDSKNQRFKSTKMRDSCRAAYRRAIADMETAVTSSMAESDLTSEGQQDHDRGHGQVQDGSGGSSRLASPDSESESVVAANEAGRDKSVIIVGGGGGGSGGGVAMETEVGTEAVSLKEES